MKNYELLNSYYQTKFKDVFFYNSLNKQDLANIKDIIEIEKKGFSNISEVKWLYSANDDYYLIGIYNNLFVTYSADGNYEELTDDFAMLPFIFMWFKDAYSSIEELNLQLAINPSLRDYFNGLIKYSKWCKEQGIIIPYEHLKWLE